jgi:hypothetical protein
MRYVLKAIDFGVSVVFLALCIKAFCVHFYQDVKRQLDAWELPMVKDALSIIPSTKSLLRNCLHRIDYRRIITADAPCFAASELLPKIKVPATRR